MARLPTADDLGELPSFESGRPIARVDLSGIAEGGQGLARGLGIAADEFGKMAERERQEQERQEEFNLARAKTDYLVGRAELDTKFGNDTRYDGLTDDYGRGLKAIGDGAEKHLTSPRAKEQFALFRRQNDVLGLANIRDKAWSNEKDALRAEADTRLDTLRKAALKSTDPLIRTSAIGTATQIIDNLAVRGVITKAQAQESRQNWARRYAWEAAQSLSPQDQRNVASGGGNAAEKSVYEFLTEGDRKQLQQQAQTQIAAAQKRIEEQARQTQLELRLRTRERYETGIEQDKVGQQEILDEPYLDNADKAELLRRWEGRNGDSLAARNVWNAIEAGEPLDPENADRGLNKIFDQVGGMAALAGGDPKALATVTYLMDKAQALPSKATAALSGMVRSSDQDKVISGLAILDSLQRKDATAFKVTFDEDVERAVLHYQDYIGYQGHSVSGPKAIFEGVRALYDAQAAKAKEPLVKAGLEKAAREYSPDRVVWLFNESGLPIGAPGAPKRVQDVQMLQQEYHRLFAEEYARDPANARKNAYEILKRKWGPSAVNSGTVMRYPPDHYYIKIDGSHAWMTEQLEGELRNRGYVVKQNHKNPRVRALLKDKRDPVANYVLQAIPETESDIASRQPPRYAVLVENPNTGTWDPVLDKNGALLAFRWDPKGPLEAFREKKRAENKERRDYKPIGVGRGVGNIEDWRERMDIE